MLALQKVATGPGQLELREVDQPEAGPGQVLIEVAFAGICGTDLHIAAGEYPSSPPVTLGHEVSGTVSAVGPGVTAVRSGDEVTTETFFSICGRCRYCRSGLPNLCSERKSIGSGVHGGFARYVVVPERNVHRLPPGVSLKLGALTEPLACVVHNVQELTQLSAGEVAVILGPGPIGLLVLQVCKANGATTVVIGTNADPVRLDAARRLGADHVINIQAAGAEATQKQVADLTGGWMADVVFECAGAAPSAESALRLVRRGGRYGQIGLFGKPVTWDADLICYKEIKLFGSFATVPTSWPKALALLAAGRIDAGIMISDVMALTEWEMAFARLRAKDALKIMLTPT